jgi:hypothetical protein
MTTNSQKITFEMRASGVREVLVYCRDHRCSHHVEISADHWSNEPDFVCTACGKRGAEVRFPSAYGDGLALDCRDLPRASRSRRSTSTLCRQLGCDPK